tara:strand:- start:348 stop:1433 length:1086 start_codon:yes stop_codon:yes gene_type:complete
MSALQENFDPPMPPGEITGRSVWYGPEMAKREEEWIRLFSDAELTELEVALHAVKSQGLDIMEVDRGVFPLPTLASVFEDIRHEILRGRGFILLRGLPVDRYSIEDSAIIYFGIGAHLGFPLPQNAKGHVLGHVKDLGRHEFDTKSRIYQTTARQTFHTDSSDIVGLLCLHPAKRGGESAIVSSDTICNEVRRRRPDLLPLLFQPYATDWRNESPSGGEGHYDVPVLSWFAGRLYCRYARRYINSAQRFKDVPELAQEEIEALDLFDSLADDPNIHLKMEFRAGDIQLIHNHQTLHDRTEFEDWPEPDRKRHLLRLWLNCHDGLPLPETLRPRFYELEVAHPGRGGLRVPGQVLNAPLEAE